jgi:hypothetical protein
MMEKIMDFLWQLQSKEVFSFGQEITSADFETTCRFINMARSWRHEIRN